MLTYNMDVTPESVWKRTTPSEAELAQPYYCTEAGVFYAQQHFSTARTDKESYLLFYTLRGAGLIEQGESHVVLSTGQALLLNCRTPQSYCTAPGQSCWHHYWVHLDGAGVAAMEPLLLPGKKLTPVQLTGVKMQEYFEMLLGQMERSTVDSMVHTGLALHEMLALCAQSILAEAETTSARQVILQAAETLRKNYQQELCLADLLAEAHMSKSYFLRLFRRYMGTTPYNYLVNFRITQAKELLVKLAEYKPLAKIEELEEQNYNMIDDRLNNGVEKFKREEEKKEQAEKPQARSSLKERLVAKQKEVAQGKKDSKEQEKSKNTIAWKLFDELSADTCLGYLKNMNFNKIVNKDYVPAVSIGGMTYGVSTLEMASAYAAIENDGVFRTPTCISKITDADYNIIVDNIEYTKSKNTSIQVKQIYQTNAARIMTDVLKGVLTVGTGRKYNISNAICAAKTGTTNDNKDVWFVGFSKYYTTAVWVGYDMPKVINDGYGNTCSGNIWKEFMTKIHDGLEIKDFVPYVTEDGILSNGEEISESQPAEETTEETADETTENEENSIYTNESDDETTTISTDNNSDNRDNRDNTETTNPYNSQVTKPSNEQAPGGADGGVYQEYWGD